VSHGSQVVLVADEQERSVSALLQAIRDRGEGLSGTRGRGRAETHEDRRVARSDELLDLVVDP
jgi:hypothetical protein